MGPARTVGDLFDLTGRRAVVTGAGGLLGSVFAQTLAEQGALVVLVDIDDAALARAHHEVGEARSSVLHLDITDGPLVDEAIAQLATTGPIDILVNSAAIDPKVEPGSTGPQGHLTTYPLDAWEDSLRVNLTGMFCMTRACCRVMQHQGQQGRGVITNISSTYGLVGPDQRIYGKADGAQVFVKPVDYPTTKAGVLGFTRAVASLYRGTEIRVNALTPGGAQHRQDDEFVRNYSDRTLLGRMATADDYRGPLAFLCSDASAYMTGANLVVDGGWTAV